MSYAIEFTYQALEDFEKPKKPGNHTVIKQTRRLLYALKDHPHAGTGKPERLKHHFSGYWSRRITQEHRLVYAIKEYEGVVTVVAAYGQYI